MRKPVAALGSGLFFVVAPGVVAGLLPWWLTGWRMSELSPYWIALRVIGAIAIAMGLIVLVQSFMRFVNEGRGTPAPIAPTEHLVVGGAYRYVRNPMYVAILAIIIGQALLLGQPVLLLYAVFAWALPAAFVRWYEEPALRKRYGAEYAAYCRAVPAWWPRLRPWNPGE